MTIRQDIVLFFFAFFLLTFLDQVWGVEYMLKPRFNFSDSLQSKEYSDLGEFTHPAFLASSREIDGVYQEASYRLSFGIDREIRFRVRSHSSLVDLADLESMRVEQIVHQHPLYSFQVEGETVFDEFRIDEGHPPQFFEIVRTRPSQIVAMEIYKNPGGYICTMSDRADYYIAENEQCKTILFWFHVEYICPDESRIPIAVSAFAWTSQEAQQKLERSTRGSQGETCFLDENTITLSEIKLLPKD